MKFIEISMPKNVGSPALPQNILINIDGIREVYVRTLYSKETDSRGYEYGFFIIHSSRQMRLHGTKSECEQGYKDMRNLLNQALSDPSMNGIVGTLTFPVSSE